MSTTYSAVYYDAAGRTYGATIFLSAATITIRYLDENRQEKVVYWLTKDTRFWQQTIQSELQYKNNKGQTERLCFQDVAFIQAIKKIPIAI
ncbi:hypothetical protein A3860_28420 [Niastella vici]|uniref:Uncharacterized protein n=1 Tax=Niastella vici TaxID=1703345 RepID=A0A1V9FVD1_9BACT|nr:hypothetical protein [Niastella vici]OQP62294.1 hypothetical protein A3860_28420 [Niastella vici]